MGGMLDDLDLIGKLDTEGMLGILSSFDRQLEEALEIGLKADIPALEAVDNVLVCGLGGSAIGGDFLSAYLGTDLKVPLSVHRNYSVPGFADEKTLALICSYSGNTEETLSAFQDAHKAGCSIICLSSNGQLQSYAEEYGYPLLQIPGGFPPRTALGYSAVPLLIALSRVGLVSDRSEEVSRSIDWVRSRIERFGAEVPAKENAAKTLARQMHRKIPVIYGSQDRLEMVARRWRGQVSENAKQLAYSSALPEMNHNEIQGWKHPAAGIGKLVPIFLRDQEDHAQVQARADITRRLVGDQTDESLEFWTEGQSWLERLWSLILLGDWASLYLAFLNQENPTPVETIEDFKKRLKEQTLKSS